MSVATPQTLPAYLTPAETRDFLRTSTQTLANWRSRGGGPPFVRVGSGKRAMIRYRVSDLTRWLDARTCVHTGTPAPQD